MRRLRKDEQEENELPARLHGAMLARAGAEGQPGATSVPRMHLTGVTVIGAFDGEDQAEAALAELERAGMPRESISLIRAGAQLPESEPEWYAQQLQRRALVVVRTDDAVLAERAREVMSSTAAEVQGDELAASSRPEVPQLTRSGERLYDVDGLEFDPVKSRFRDFSKS